MEKKSKIHLTNEEVLGKFKSSFELVNYAIKLAENMINTGRDARVKSDIQNRAMLTLEEIRMGQDRFDEIKPTSSSHDSDHATPQPVVYEERLERRRSRVVEAFDEE